MSKCQLVHLELGTIAFLENKDGSLFDSKYHKTMLIVRFE